jgi:hypothetical protein
MIDCGGPAAASTASASSAAWAVGRRELPLLCMSRALRPSYTIQARVIQAQAKPKGALLLHQVNSTPTGVPQPFTRQSQRYCTLIKGEWPTSWQREAIVQRGLDKRKVELLLFSCAKRSA